MDGYSGARVSESEKAKPAPRLSGAQVPKTKTRSPLRAYQTIAFSWA